MCPRPGSSLLSSARRSRSARPSCRIATSRRRCERSTSARRSPLPRPSCAALVMAVGASVMLGGAHALARALGVGDIDAEAGRTAGEVLGVLQERADDGRLGPTVVVHVGNNGPLKQQDMDGIMRVL